MTPSSCTFAMPLLEVASVYQVERSESPAFATLKGLPSRVALPLIFKYWFCSGIGKPNIALFDPVFLTNAPASTSIVAEKPIALDTSSRDGSSKFRARLVAGRELCTASTDNTAEANVVHTPFLLMPSMCLNSIMSLRLNLDFQRCTAPSKDTGEDARRNPRIQLELQFCVLTCSVVWTRGS